MRQLLLRGTLLLTIAGILSRIMGFFYRIFLANTIGAEGMGIYQLIFPIYSVCFSLCASGLETAISKLTAAKHALGNRQEASGTLKTGLILTLLLSLCSSFVVFYYANTLAIYFLKEPQCVPLLKILAFSIPFGTLHACICGYYFGIHKASVPAFSQLIEQIFRMGCVFLLYRIYLTNKINIS
jgi:stage V sporulation protein B